MNDYLTNPNPVARKTFALAVFSALHVMREDLAERREGQPAYVHKALSDMIGAIEVHMASIRVRQNPGGSLWPLWPLEPVEIPEWDRAAKVVVYTFPLWLVSAVRDMMADMVFLRAEYDGLTREDAAAVRRELGAIIASSTDA